MENENKHVWVTASCFYPINGWDKLLKEVSRLLENLQDKKNYEISLNSEFGENIRLAVLVPESIYNDVVLYFSNSLNDFFFDNFYPSLTAAVDTPTLPFPTSIIQFNLYDKIIPFNQFHLDKNESLSNCIVEALNEDVDYESIATLSCYLHLTLLHVSLTFAKIEIFKNCVFETALKRNTAAFTNNRNVSRSYISEIFLEVSDIESLHTDYPWLYKWRAQIRQELISLLNSNTNSNNSNLIQEFFKQNSALLKNQLNLSATLTSFTEDLIDEFVTSMIEKEHHPNSE